MNKAIIRCAGACFSIAGCVLFSQNEWLLAAATWAFSSICWALVDWLRGRDIN